jgi:hypothetical protein
MNTLTKLALGLTGHLRPQPALGEGAPTIALPAQRIEGGKPLMQALRQRRSQREFAPQPLPRQMQASGSGELPDLIRDLISKTEVWHECLRGQ